MADVKISELTALTSPDGAEELVVNDGGTTKKITITNATSVKANIASPVFTGNVGIGNNSPASSVGSCVDATGPLLVGGHINSHQTNKSVIENNSNNMKLRAYGATSGTGYMTFNTGGGGDAADAEAMRIDSLGSVGIGTSSPTGNLDVTGTANSTVSITAAGIANDSLLNFVQGSAIEGGITYDHASGYTNEKMIFRAGNNTAHMTITGAGNVGIGVVPEASYAGRPTLRIGAGLTIGGYGSGNPSHHWINANAYQAASDATEKYIGADQASQLKQTNGTFAFNVAPNGTADAAISWTTAMTISNAGVLESFATAVGNYGFKTTNNGATPYGQLIYMPNGTNGTVQAFLVCRDGSTNRLIIYANGDVANVNNSYGAISDRKLKENIEDASSQWDDIKAVRVRNYSLIADGESTANRIGVIAQELEDSGMYGLVNESNDTDEVLDVDWIPSEGETEDDRPTKRVDLGTTTKSVKYSILYMKAIKALQEAIIKIEALENRIEALEAT